MRKPLCGQFETTNPGVPVSLATTLERLAPVARKDQALAAAEAIIQQLKEALRLERIRKYGKRSENLSGLQLELLDHEPALSSDEIETEIASGPLSEEPQEQNASTAAQQQKKCKPHPGRNELPAHLERIEEIVACAAEQCTCGKCGRETKVIGYEQTEVLSIKPAVYFVRVIKRAKRACKNFMERGVVTAAVPERWAELTRLVDHPVIELSTNWPKRPTAIRNWICRGFSREASRKARSARSSAPLKFDGHVVDKTKSNHKLATKR